MEKKKIYYPYNESFNVYGPPRAGLERAQAFVDDKNQYKGGHWVVHTKEQHDEWWEKEKNKEFLRPPMIGFRINPGVW